MKKIIVAALAVVTMAFGSNAMAAGAPFKVTDSVTKERVGNFYNVYRNIHVTATDDGVVVNKLTVNRNACGNPIGVHGPVAIQYGRTVTWKYIVVNGFSNTTRPCNVIEIVVDTNKGTWKLNPQ